MRTNGKIQLFPVLRICLFFVAGILAGDGFYGVVPPYVWHLLLLLSLISALFLRRHDLLQGAAIFASCLFLGCGLACTRLSRTDVALPEQAVNYHAVIVSAPKITGKVVRCDMVVVGRGRPVKIMANIFRDSRSVFLREGDGIEARSVMKKPWNFSDSTFDYRRYLINHNFSATTFINMSSWRKAAVDLTPLSLSERTRIAALRLRNRILDRYRCLGIDGGEYAVVAAMTLGDKSALSYGQKEEYSVSGAYHVLALSGLHLGIIYAMLSLLFSGRRFRIAGQVAAVCAVWVYVFIVGMPVSVVRSAVMLTVYSFASLLGRSRMSLNALSVAAVIILAISPMYVYDVGFQMSFAAVLFILIFYKPIYGLMPYRLSGILPLRWLWQAVSVSVSAQIGVAPLVAFYFGRFSCYFLLANLIAVPLAVAILYITVFMLLSGMIPIIQTLLSGFLVKAVALLNGGVTFVASLPGASIDGISINLVQLVMIYVMILSLRILSVYLRKMRLREVVVRLGL